MMKRVLRCVCVWTTSLPLRRRDFWTEPVGGVMEDGLLLTTTPDKGAHLLDPRSGALLHVLKDCRPCNNGMCATGGYVLGAEKNRSFLHAWSWHKEQPRYRCQAPERVMCLTCTADGAHCIGGGASGKLYLWQVATGRLLFAWDGHFKPCTALATALCDGYLLSAGEDALVLAWSFADLLHSAHNRQAAPAPFRTWSDHTLPVSALCVASLGAHDLIASAAADQTVRLWRISEACKGCVHSIELPCALVAVAIHPHHSYIYAGGADGSLHSAGLLVEDAAGIQEAGGATGGGALGSTPSASGVRSAVASRSGQLRSVAVSPDGTRCFTAGGEPGVKVWDSLSLALLLHLQPTVPFDSLQLIRRPVTIGLSDHDHAPASAGATASTSELAISSASAETAYATAAVHAVPFNLSPLKKFSEAAQAMDEGSEGSQRAMGCVPCDLRRGGGGFGGGSGYGGGGGFRAPAAGGTALLSDLDPDEAELPLLAWTHATLAAHAAHGGLPLSLHAAPSHSLQGDANGASAHGGGAVGEFSDLETAEATVRHLRSQLHQMQNINRELYQMAADATLGSATARGTAGALASS